MKGVHDEARAPAHVHHHDPASHGWLADVVVWAPSVLLLTLLVGGYLALVSRRAGTTGRRWRRRRTAAWVVGAALLALGFSPALHAAAHAGPRGHMVQHLLLGMYAPVGLVLAAPVTLLLGAAGAPGRRRIAAVLGSRPVGMLTHPLVATVVDVGGLCVLYLTGLYAASVGNGALHLAINVHLVLAGSLFTWAIVRPDPAPHPRSLGLRATALVLAAAAHAVLAKALYAQAPALPPGAGLPRAELEGAAVLMYYGGDLAELAVAVALFAAWYRAQGLALRRARRAWPMIGA